VLLVLPESGTAFEAYRPIHSDPISFEGFYEWVVHSLAHTETNWKAEKQWNEPTSKLLAPGESVTYGLRFVLSPSLSEIENTLIAHGHPVAVGLPGYVLPKNETSQLFIHSEKKIIDVKMSPEGAIQLNPLSKVKHGWKAYKIQGIIKGPSRLTLYYEDGEKLSIHYFTIPSQKESVQKLAKFHEEKQWFEETNDPFGRTYSYIS
jgi:Family of unknown function (DUF5695)